MQEECHTHGNDQAISKYEPLSFTKSECRGQQATFVEEIFPVGLFLEGSRS